MSESSRNPTRREFAKGAVAAAVTPVLASLAACAPGRPEPAPSPAAGAAAVGGVPVAPSAPPRRENERERDPVAEELTEALRARYGGRLTPAQWDEVREAVEGNLRAAKSLREFELPIGTEPPCAFRAYRGGGR